MNEVRESENVAAMRRGYEAIGRGDFEALADVIDPELEVHDRPESPDAGSYHGLDGARRALDSTFEYFDDVSLLPEEFHEQGDHIVVVIRLTGRGKGSGVPVDERLAHLWRLRDGRPHYLQVYTHPEDAMRDAGIAPR